MKGDGHSKNASGKARLTSTTGIPAFTGSYADWAQTLIYLCEMTFTIAMTVGSVKGAQTLTSKAFGL